MYVQDMLTYTMVRASSLCLRGSMVKWSGLGSDGSTPLSTIMFLMNIFAFVYYLPYL